MSALLVTEESNDELAQFTTGAQGITSTDIRNALSLIARSDVEQSASVQKPSTITTTDSTANTLLSEVCERTAFTESNKVPKTYVQRIIDVPVCPTCQRPYMLAQLYFKLLQTAVESSRRSYYKHFFRQLGCIGSGSFGTVYRVRHQLNAVELGVYAIKIISVGASRPWLLKALSEVTVLEKLRHQNIVQYHHCWAERYRTALNAMEETLHLFILLNYCKGGSLLNLRRSIFNRQMTEEEVLFLLFQAASGLAHLHAIGFLSRDVKLGNMLLDGDVPDDDPKGYISCIYNDPAESPDTLTIKQKQELRYKQRQFRTDESLREHCRQLQYIRRVGVEGLRVRITDFGQVGDGASAGTELYLAPELYCAISGALQATEHASNDASGGDSMNGEESPDLDRNFIIRDKSFPEFVPTKPKSTQATDIYSLGISFLVLLFDYEEFAATTTDFGAGMAYDDYINSYKHQQDLLESISKLRSIYSVELCDLFAVMCSPDPSVRPSASEVASFCFSQRLRAYNASVPAPSNTSAFNSSRGGTLTNAIQLYSHRKEMYATSSVQKPKKENTVCLLDQYTVASSPSSSNLGGIQDSEENSNKPLRERFKHVISKADDISTEATSELIEADVPYSTLRPLVPNTFSLGKRERQLHTNKRHRHRGHSTVGHRRTSRSRCSVQHFFPVLIAINSVGILTVIYLLQLLLRK
ncbi:Kinase [Giardia lamblia P15]|uniref:Kinase n=1 Tax=Giardia intestinalis (strain P15) TaxID=658858 RepID=E1EYI0_GIAIA|nr:Kinase [Giardia lamblia P15]